MNPKRRPKS